MSDYVVAVGFETDAATVKRSTDQLADSVGKVGQAQQTAAKSTKDLTSASAELERVQKLIEVRTRKLEDATSAVSRMQARGITNSKEYTRAVEQQLKAEEQLASAVKRADTLKQGGGGEAPKESGSKAGEHLAAIGAGIVAGLGLGDAINDSIAEFGKLNAAVQDGKGIFGEYAKGVDDFAKNSASSIGQSRTAVLAETNDLGGLFQTLSIGEGQSASMSKALVTLSSDLGALHDADPSDVFDALKGGLTGQYDSLQKYNVVLSAASVRQEAMRLGLVHGKEALSASAQAQAAYSLIVQQTADANGAFANSGDVVARQQMQLQAAISNAKLELGRGLTPAIIALSHIAEHTLLPALKVTGEAIGFIGSHASTRHIVELMVTLYGAAKAVDLLAAAWGRVAVAAGAAAAEEGAAGVAGAGAGAGAGRTALARSGGFLVANPVVTVALGALVYGVKQLLDDRTKQQKIGSDVSAAEASGPAAEIMLAAKYGVSRGNGPGQFIVDPKISADQRNAGIKLLEAADRQLAAAKELHGYLQNAGPLTAAQQAALSRSAATSAEADKGRLAVSYAQAFMHDPAALHASAAQQALPALFAAPPPTPVAKDLTADNNRISSARRAVSLAEDRLTALRKTGKATAVQLEAAENSLANARDRLAAATSKRSKDQATKNTDTSISAADIKKRADKAARTSIAEVGDVRKLVAAGLNAPVIEELKKLEQSAPGTIANVAKALTPAFVHRLNADADARAKASEALAMLGGQARYNDSVKRAKILGEQAGKAFHDGWLLGLYGTGARQGLPLDDTRPPPPPRTPPAPAGKPAGPAGRQGIPIDERTTASLPTRTVSAAPVVHLSTESVAKVATSLATLAPRQTVHNNQLTVLDYDDYERQARDREAFTRLGG